MRVVRRWQNLNQNPITWNIWLSLHFNCCNLVDLFLQTANLEKPFFNLSTILITNTSKMSPELWKTIQKSSQTSLPCVYEAQTQFGITTFQVNSPRKVSFLSGLGYIFTTNMTACKSLSFSIIFLCDFGFFFVYGKMSNDLLIKYCRPALCSYECVCEYCN